MNLFKFLPVTGSEISLESGELINGWKSLTWTERYRDACEFTLVADLDSGLNTKLPIGAIISHTDSKEVMIVESHEIVKDTNANSEITITGRSFETFLENRIVGSNQDWPTPSGAPVDYVLASNYSAIQAKALIDAHILTSALPLNLKDALSSVSVVNSVTGTYDTEQRDMKRADLYSSLIEVLSFDNLGIRNIRPTASNSSLIMEIHKGLNKTASVAFSYSDGDIESANYLWSVKALKNCALVSGKWHEVFVDSALEGYQRRVMHVDASYLDDKLAEAPIDAELTSLAAKLTTQGRQALARQNAVAISNVKIAPNSQNYNYRTDYNVGDIVGVDGEYNTSTTMRVIEYVEIEDENGESGYPTLSEL
jgi:hypothetical protein